MGQLGAAPRIRAMKRRLATAVAAMIFGFAAVLAGCAGWGLPRTVTLSQERMQSLVERQFPRQQRLFDVIDLTVDRPTLRLLPERNHIATYLDLTATDRLSGRTARGSLALDYALRYEASDASVRLSQVQVTNVQLELGSGPLSPSAARLGAVLAERLLDDFVLYRADAERLQQLQRAGVTVAEIAVTVGGIELRFAQPR
jgi:hypothetical protein